MLFLADLCVILPYMYMSYLSQGLPGPDGPAGEKGESVSAAQSYFL